MQYILRLSRIMQDIFSFKYANLFKKTSIAVQHRQRLTQKSMATPIALMTYGTATEVGKAMEKYVKAHPELSIYGDPTMDIHAYPSMDIQERIPCKDTHGYIHPWTSTHGYSWICIHGYPCVCIFGQIFEGLLNSWRRVGDRPSWISSSEISQGEDPRY